MSQPECYPELLIFAAAFLPGTLFSLLQFFLNKNQSHNPRSVHVLVRSISSRPIQTANGKGRKSLYLGPGADGVQVDATVDERGCEFPPPGLERVGAQRDRPLALVGLNELQRLWNREQAQHRVQQEAVVAVVQFQVALQLRAGPKNAGRRV